MSDMAKIQIIGRLGKDPQTRQAGDQSVCSFSVAVGEGRGDDKVTTWYRVSAWGKHGDACAKYLKKGSQVYVDGKLSITTQERNGETFTNVDIKNANVVFLDKQEQQEEKAPPKRQSRSAPVSDDSDIPF